MGATTVLIMLITLAWWLITVVGILDAALRPNSMWQAADQSKVAWVLAQIATGAVGAVVYFIAVQPRIMYAGSAALTNLRLPDAAYGSSTRTCVNPRCEADGLPTPLERCDICGQGTVAAATAAAT